MDYSANLIEQFVTALNSNCLEPLFEQDVPPELRTKELTETAHLFEWEIRPSDFSPWVEALEERLPYRLPPLYRFFISRYKFAAFEVGSVMFLANTGADLFQELSRVLFADKGLYPLLLEHGFVQFGKQAGGGYDPVCFAMNRTGGRDAPVVQVDHEEALTRNRIRVTTEIAPTFQAFVEQVIAGKFRSG